MTAERCGSEWVFLAPEPEAPVEPGPTPTFSVIIAAYNVAHLVGDAVASALAQTLAPVEVIVCDDGSTDDLEGALARVRERITLIRKAHGGESSAKNAAARAASGDFVAILDGDDVFCPHRLEALGALARARPDLDLLVSDADVVEEGRVLRRFHGPLNSFETHDQRRVILERNFIAWPAIRRDRYLAAGGFDEQILLAADWECCIRLILDGAKAGLVDAPLMEYRRRPGQMTEERVAMFGGRVEVLEKTSRNPGLGSADRATLVGFLRTARLRLAREARRVGDPRARPAALAVARDPGFDLRTRIGAAATVVSPALARRWSARRAP